MLRFHTVPRAASLVAATMTLTLLASAGASADQRGRQGRHGPPRLDRAIEKNAEAIGVDASVVEQARAIAEAGRTEGKALREAERAADGALRELIEAGADSTAIRSQLERVADARVESQAQRIATMMEIRSLLTPEQRAALDELRPAARGERSGKGDRRRGGRRGGKGCQAGPDGAERDSDPTTT